MSHSTCRALLVVSLLALCTACGHSRKRSGVHGGPMGHLELLTYGRELYDLRCLPCHGPHGKGDGPAAAALQPKPRNYADKAWQDSVTDERISQAIVDGGKGVGKSQLMPPQSDLRDDPEAVKAIVTMVRSFRPK